MQADEDMSIGGFLANAVNQATQGEEVIRIDNPNGDGSIHYIKNGRGGYDQEIHEGGKRRVRRHTFEHLLSFANFVNRHALDIEGTDILVGKGQVTADFSPKSAEATQVSLSLSTTGDLQAWMERTEESASWMSLSEFVRFCRLHMHEITEGELHVAGIRDFSIAVTRDGHVEENEMGVVVAHSNKGTVAIQGKVPTELRISPRVFKCSEHVATALVLVECKIVEDRPRFRLHFDKWDEVLLTAREVIREELHAALDPGYMVGVGTHSGATVAECDDGDPYYERGVVELPDEPEPDSEVEQPDTNEERSDD